MLAEHENGCRGTTRTCIYGFRDRRPAIRRPGNGGGLRSRPSATKSPLALAPRPPASGVNPPKMVGPDGNAPSSLAYRASALLLSYEPMMAESGGLAPQPANRSVCFRGSARALAGSLSKMAESSGPAPQALRLESASNRSPRFAALLSINVAEARGHAPQRPVAAQSASNGCWRLGQFRLRKSPRQDLHLRRSA